MSNSSLISYTNISPSKNSPRNQKIDTITIHCMAGQMTAKSCCDMFAKKANQVSANYCIGYDGKIGLSVDEKDRSWCSSSGANDHRAITIEVASDSSHPYAVKAAAYQSLLNLVTDICKRNNITKLVWGADKDSRVNHKNGCNMTVHRDFSYKSCPGEYLYNKMPEIANEVNKRLGAVTTTTNVSTASGDVYRIRKTWADAKSQIGAYRNLASAKSACKEGYSVFDSNGKAAYTYEEHIYRIRKTWADGKDQRGAYKTLALAKEQCNKYYGYSVFDEKGNAIYKSVAVLGDVTGDGKVTVDDSRMVLSASVGKTTLTDDQKTRADYNQDGKVDVADAREILNKSINK